MLLIRDITWSDYQAVGELLDSNGLGIGGSYSPEGLHVIVAELHESVIAAAEFQLDCDFGRGEGRPDHPGEQAWILAMAVADTHRRHGVGRTLITEIARRGWPHLPCPGPPGRRRYGWPRDVFPGVRTRPNRAWRIRRGLGLPG